MFKTRNIKILSDSLFHRKWNSHLKFNCNFYFRNFLSTYHFNNQSKKLFTENDKRNNENFCFKDSNVLKDENNSPEFSEIKAEKKNSGATINLIQTPIIKSNFKKDFLELTKFKLCVLNSFVSLSTYTFYCTNQCALDYFLFGLGTISIAMTTQVLNQLVEKNLDKKMKRTESRPLPKQRMTDQTALLIARNLWVFSFFCYSLSCPQAIMFSNLIIFIYILCYTPLKRKNNLSMHIGAIVGGLPAILGSYAATNFLLLPESLLLAGYIFAWQYPHFYGILYQNKDDYKKAGFKFISNDDCKTKYAYFQMLASCLLMSYIVYKFNQMKISFSN
jgi:protoheme IX farnesyltransferase